jgi:hypothetical protein
VQHVAEALGEGLFGQYLNHLNDCRVQQLGCTTMMPLDPEIWTTLIQRAEMNAAIAPRLSAMATTGSLTDYAVKEFLLGRSSNSEVVSDIGKNGGQITSKSSKSCNHNNSYQRCDQGILNHGYAFL